MFVLGVTVVRRYDLLQQMFDSLRQSEVQPDRLLVVDNGCKFDQSQCILPEKGEVIRPGRNVGVSASWNLMSDICPDDLLVVANDDIRFKPYSLGRLVKAATGTSLVEGPGFLLCAVTAEARRKIGEFDENFFPAYFEDNDYARRCSLAKVMQGRVGTDIDHEGSASLRCLTSKQQAEFGKQFSKNGAYYRSKWGGLPGKEKFSEPFNGSPPPGWSLRPITRGGKVEPEPWL